jgi:eukaryotic-like serine/threonine-protein kinase
MTDDPHVEELLEELLDSDATPEDVCRECPELLPEVRAGWQRLRALKVEVGALFPESTSLDGATPDGAPAEDLPSDLPHIDGYEFQAVLGRGGVGVVYKAWHARLNRPVALKMLLVGRYARPEELERFFREAEAVASLRHANIVQVYDVGDLEGRPYFTMEFVEGGSLAQKLAGTPQPASQAAALVATLAKAIQAAHQKGIIHRDLKPANILLTADGTPKISDFGLARKLEDGVALTLTGSPVGTPSYMAPEQAQGQRDGIGPATDVYALGAILYEMLTGRPPFRAETSAATVQQVLADDPVAPSRLNPQVPRDLETICLKCLQKEPQRRYATAAELAEELLRFHRGEPILARRAGSVERAVKWVRRHRSLAAAIVIGILFLNVLFGVGGWVLFERSALKRAVGEDLDQVSQAQKDQKWDQARTALARAKGRLGGGGPPELRQRAAQLERELALVATLEHILLPGAGAEMDSRETWARRTAARYEEALQAGGLVNGLEDSAVVAARIRATGIAAPVLAALDDWASYDLGRQVWLQEVARQVDEDPASRPIRDAKLWENKAALEEFAKSAPLANQSVPFLKFLGSRLARLRSDPIPFLKRVQLAHANSLLANAELAMRLLERGNPADSVRYFQAAIALQPTEAGLHYNLGSALGDLKRWDEALVELKEANRLAPGSALFDTSIGKALNNMKKRDDAEQHFRKVLETHPNYAPCLTDLAYCLGQRDRHTESIDTSRRAIAADPNYAEAHRRLTISLRLLRRWEEGRYAWQAWLALNPQDESAWVGYAELCLYLGKEAEYRQARTDLLRRFGATTDLLVADRTGRACLLLPATDGELKQANALIDRALAVEKPNPPWIKPNLRFAKALAEYRADRMKNAQELLQGDTVRVLSPAPSLLLAMVQHRLGQADAARKTFDASVRAFDWDAAKVINRESRMIHLLRREAESVLASKP